MHVAILKKDQRHPTNMNIPYCSTNNFLLYIYSKQKTKNTIETSSLMVFLILMTEEITIGTSSLMVFLILMMEKKKTFETSSLMVYY